MPRLRVSLSCESVSVWPHWSPPKLACVCWCLWACMHLHGLHIGAQYCQTWRLSTQLRSGERTGRRLLWSTTLLLPTLLSDSQVSISLVIHGLRCTVSRQVKAHVMLTCTNWVSLNHLLVTWPATSHEPHCQHIPINKIWRWTESTPWSRWWRSHMVGIYSDCSTHSKLCDPSRTVCILQDQQQVRVMWREATSPHARIVPTFAARNCFVWMCQHQAKPRSTKTACGKCVTFNRWRAVVSATWKYDDPRLNMSHEGAVPCVMFCRLTN